MHQNIVKTTKVELLLSLSELVVFDAPKNYSIVYTFNPNSKVFSLLLTKDEEVSEPEVEENVVISAVKDKEPKAKEEIFASEIESFYSSKSKSEKEEKVEKVAKKDDQKIKNLFCKPSQKDKGRKRPKMIYAKN